MSKKPKSDSTPEVVKPVPARKTGWYPKPPSGDTEMVHSVYGNMKVRKDKDGKKA